MSVDVDGKTSWGRPKWRWKDVVNADLRKKHLNISLASGRSKWRNANSTLHYNPLWAEQGDQMTSK